jgi:hypothetical protein
LSSPQFSSSNIEVFATKFEVSMGDIRTFQPVVEGGLQLLDDLIRQRAVDEDQTPLLAYPKSKLGITDYEFFTGRELNRLVDAAAKALIKRGIKPVVCPPLSSTIQTNIPKLYEETTAGIYGNPNIDYVITIFGLGRLGYTTFISAAPSSSRNGWSKQLCHLITLAPWYCVWVRLCLL